MAWFGLNWFILIQFSTNLIPSYFFGCFVLVILALFVFKRMKKMAKMGINDDDVLFVIFHPNLKS